MPGFVAFYTAKDIPGRNAFISNDDKHFTVGMDEIVRIHYKNSTFTIKFQHKLIMYQVKI